MKREYRQVYSSGMDAPKLHFIQVDGASPRFFEGETEISELEFRILLKKAQTNEEYSEFKTIVITDDDGKTITEAIHSNDMHKNRFVLKTMVNGEEFEYEQMKGDVRVGGMGCFIYMNVRMGNKENEYVDKQTGLEDPLLDTSFCNGHFFTHSQNRKKINGEEIFDIQPRIIDPLLDIRDELVKPFLDVFSGRKNLVDLNVSESVVLSQPSVE